MGNAVARLFRGGIFRTWKIPASEEAGYSDDGKLAGAILSYTGNARGGEKWI
jgi:hypothetical protein